MTIDSNRLLLELEKARREVNRAIINPEIRELSLEELQPMLELVAHVRAAYVSEFLELASTTRTVPSAEQIDRLAELRRAFDELVAAANAVETMISRGYLDVRPAPRKS